MKPSDIVLYYFSEYDEEDVDWLLYNHSSWPWGTLEWINEEIYTYYLKNKR
jgi:hypothetical protein